MNTVLKRKLSSMIASESIVNNISKGKHIDFINETSVHKNNHKNNHKNTVYDRKNKDQFKPKGDCKGDIYNEKTNKRQKKTHYNEQMEPIRLSGNCSGVGIDTNHLPKRIREVVWNTYNGETYSSKCYVRWCSNIINVFNYQVGHDIPESKGGTYNIGNLRPICSNCNLSMGNKWTIQEWGKLINNKSNIEEQSQKEEQSNIAENKRKLTNELTEKIDLPYDITLETTSRITFITLLVLALNFMIY